MASPPNANNNSSFYNAKGQTMSHQALTRPIREWLVEQALGEPDIVAMFELRASALPLSGFPLRVHD
ncbi:MAG: hypothetical protein R3D29_08570 [Nitratireductor sp.]